MKLLRSIFFTFFLTVMLAAAGFAQANSLKQISFVFDRYSGYNSNVRLIGDNIAVTAQFRSSTAPMVCSPCTPNTALQFGPAFDDSGIIFASGTIDGIFYPNLYVLHSLHYTGGQTSRIPRSWMKTVRLSAPVTLTGNVGIWTRPEDVGITAAAVYLHNNINFMGEANLSLRWSMNSGSRLFTDKYLALTFTYAEN
jgi:hypothetical protein